MDNIDKNVCKICNKKYSSYKTLWYHNKTQHTTYRDPNVFQSDPACSKSVPKMEHYKNETVNNDMDNQSYKCSYCMKNYANRHSKWKHEQLCKNKCNKNESIDEIKEEMKNLRDLLQKALKIHPRTLQKINKQLNNNISNNNNNNTNSNNIIYNTQIYQLGQENLTEVLTEKQKLKILNRQAMSINDLVELVHTSNKYNQFKNVSRLVRKITDFSN